jgi:hypothetical protein
MHRVRSNGMKRTNLGKTLATIGALLTGGIGLVRVLSSFFLLVTIYSYRRMKAIM